MPLRLWAIPAIASAILPVWAPLAAQDRFEPEVYGYATVPAGAWELETHLTYTTRGTRDFDARVAPSEHQGRLALEVTRGLSDFWEVSGYLLGATRAGGGVEFAGWRGRTRVRAPGAWHLPVDLGLSVEMEFARPAFSESSATLEVTPILERRWGSLLLGFTPSLERDLNGPESKDGWELEPGARIAVDVSPSVTLQLEYLGSAGHLSRLFPRGEQAHQVYPGVTLRLGDDFAFNLGVGVGLGSEGDRFALKSRFEMPLGGEPERER